MDLQCFGLKQGRSLIYVLTQSRYGWRSCFKIMQAHNIKKTPKKYLWSLNYARRNSEELLKIEILDLNALLDLNLTSGSYIKQLHEVTKVTPGRNSAISDMIFAMQFTPFLGSKYYSITVFKTILNPCIIKTLYIDLLSRRSIFKKLNS